MNRKQLDAFLDERGFCVDQVDGPISECTDLVTLCIGIGRSPIELESLAKELKAAMPELERHIQPRRIRNHSHDDYEKRYLRVGSYFSE